MPKTPGFIFAAAGYLPSHTDLFGHLSCKNGRPGGSRTPNFRIWSPALYQFELLACTKLFRFLMRSMGPAKWTVLLQLQLVRGTLFVFCRRIITPLTCATCKSYNISHSKILYRKSTLPFITKETECYPFRFLKS